MATTGLLTHRTTADSGGQPTRPAIVAQKDRTVTRNLRALATSAHNRVWRQAIEIDQNDCTLSSPVNNFSKLQII